MSFSPPPPPKQPFKHILIPNRGEITVRIVQSLRELPSPPLTTLLYTPTDSTHVSLSRPDFAIEIPNAACYTDINYLIGLVKHSETPIDAIHPGYGFLSESAEFSERMWKECRFRVIGPGVDVLRVTGDKVLCRGLARECGVPVLEAMSEATADVEVVREWVGRVGVPVMVKAVDGGGGRGIRLVREMGQLEEKVRLCVGESPSGRVFAEQAAVNGYKHVEVQIVGDGRGSVRHLWERDCSVQRRFQKIVEIAPAPVAKRRIIAKVIEAAVRMARRIKYLGLGTWEFLVNVKERKFFFLEINPRLQVEHTITECITGVDLVKEQVLFAQGTQNPEDLRLGEWWEADKPPSVCSIQLRLCAEDPSNGFALSIGKVTDVQFPSGNGVRVDSHLSRGGIVGSDFDNMMAKIIVTASTWQDTVLKAQRALADTKIVGVKTNLSLLRAIVADKGFRSGATDTQWLEANMTKLIKSGDEISRAIDEAASRLPSVSLGSSQPSAITSSATTFRKGDAWKVTLEDPTHTNETPPPAHHLSLDRIVRNEFPEAIVANLSFTAPGVPAQQFKVTATSTNTSSEATSSTHRRGDPNNKSHVILPMSGKLIEVLVEEGDEVRENEVIAFVKQMKMELEIRSPRAGTVGWVIEMENDDGDDVAEGVLLAELVDDSTSDRPELKSKL